MQSLRGTALRTRVLLLAIASLFLSFGAVSLAAPPDPALAQAIGKALDDPCLAHGVQGVVIESLKDGRILYEKNGGTLFLPASNLKLVVSSAALDLLGPDYRMGTTLCYTGTVGADGVLKGDLILVGSGDPVFTPDDLKSMVARVKELGVRSVKGRIVGDDSYYDDVRLGVGWAWDDESYYYSAEISALNVGENVVDVWVHPGAKVGDPAVVKMNPMTGYMLARNDCKTGEAGSPKTASVDRAHGRNTVRIVGSVPIDYKPVAAEESIAVCDPTLFACRSLKEILQREHIDVKGQIVRGKRPETAEVLAAHQSPPLSQVLALLNKPSDNLIAECLLKQLGAKLKGKGSAASGLQAEQEYLQRIGADMTAVNIVDGSGLSRNDCISPRNLLAVLKYMYRHKDFKAFYDSLPIAGVDGTMKKRLKGTSAEGNVHAKTGYVSHISSVSGYVTTKSGEPIAFSILMNNHLCRNKEAIAVQDKIIGALADLGAEPTATPAVTPAVPAKAVPAVGG